MSARTLLLTGGVTLTFLRVATYAVFLTLGLLWLWMPTLGTLAILAGLVVAGRTFGPGAIDLQGRPSDLAKQRHDHLHTQRG